jgi:hypothetical protein
MGWTGKNHIRHTISSHLQIHDQLWAYKNFILLPKFHKKQ